MKCFETTTLRMMLRIDAAKHTLKNVCRRLLQTCQLLAPPSLRHKQIQCRLCPNLFHPAQLTTNEQPTEQELNMSICTPCSRAGHMAVL